ncbi:MAG: acyl-CoA dehydrogenase family protein [Myxococcota bacterium]
MTSVAQAENSPENAHGGEFLHKPVGGGKTFTPEMFSEDHRRMYETALEFVRAEVEPRAEDIDHKKPGAIQDVMRKAADLGLFMVGIPEEFGGLGLDKTTSMLIAEALSSVGSFAVTFGAHTGIGTLPLVYYGTKQQKERYLPKLATGEWFAAYCLSEQGSGSDALAAKTVAKLSSDGKTYVLNGTKAWITNGGFADLYTIFAQVVEGDTQKFTAFLVERNTPGLSIGKEERKLGIRGSSTTQVILDDVEIPADNVLGEVGRGHKIAFNILNIGRWKLGIGTVGACKYALEQGVRYAKERHQFKKPIATFGLIRKKIAEAARLIYAGESMAYRTSGYIDGATAALEKGTPDYWANAIKVIEEFTIEASILKVFGSEILASIADEMLQIHGGNGYTEDYPIERVFRDARINRIFEGTNEINRLIIPATMFKRTLQGRLPLLQYTQTVVAELNQPDKLPQRGSGPLADEIHQTALVQRALVYAASYAAQKYLDDLKNKQRILGGLADAVINLYAMDTVVARATQAIDSLGEEKASIHKALASLYCFEAKGSVLHGLDRMAMIMAEGDELDTLWANLRKFHQRYRVDIMALQDKVAGHMLKNDGYAL